MSKTIKVYLETGAKRVFAAALDWPGWCRSGKDQAEALQSLLDYGPRYADVLRRSRIAFAAPKSLAALNVVEKLAGNSTTDFGAPDAQASSDLSKMTAADLKRSEALLQACWAAFDAATKRAKGIKLRLGPRGGGRTLQKMIDHVHGSEEAYIAALGWWTVTEKPGAEPRSMAAVREGAIAGLRASVAGEIPAVGPRGGKRWPARYFLRRAAWHILDHAWEIEDRIE